MTAFEGFPINFTITKAARVEIETMRADWNSKFPDKADVVSVAWGELVTNDRRKSGVLCVSFYGKSMRPEIEKGIETLDGLEILFYVNRFNHSLFRGKVIDYDEESGLHLR